MALSDRHIVGVKSESTYGDDAFTSSAPTDSEWLGIIGEPSIQERTVDVPASEKTADGLGGQILRYGEATDVSFSTYLVGKESTAGDPPPVIADLYKASNLDETVNSGTSVDYATAYGRSMASVPAMTVYEGIRDDVSGDYFTRVVTGVRGVPTFVFEDGQDARVNYEGVGLYSEMTTSTTAISAPSSYSGGKNRLKCQGMTLTYDGTQYPITSAEVVTGLEVDEDRELGTDHAVDEVGLYLPNEAKPGGSVTFKARSNVITTILGANVQPDNGSFTVVPTADLVITLTDGTTDTIEITMTDCAFGAHSKNLAGGNYLFDVPFTALGGLSISFT